jgi:hypothetical protein
MSKLGTFASYLIWTSVVGIIGWGLSALISLNPTAQAINTFAGGTWLGYVFLGINFAFYPLQLGLGILLTDILNIGNATGFYIQVTIASIILLLVGLLLRVEDNERESRPLGMKWKRWYT